MYRFIIILVVLIILGVPGTVCAQEIADGTITGQVVNGTEGGDSVAGIEVTLLTYIDDALAETRTARVDNEGKFIFDKVVIEHQYLLSARYMDVDYYYPAVFDENQTTTHVEVGVCDTTTSDQTISVVLAHTIVNVEEENLLVTEVFWLVNGGDRTYTGTGANGVLVFTLPEEAISFEAPQDLMLDYQLLENNKVSYLVPFPPGERQLVYAYRIDKAGLNEITIPLEIHYPTDSLELMVGGENIEVTVNQLIPTDPVITDTGERFIHYRGENLSRHTVIGLTISGLSGDGNFLFIVVWGIIGVVVVGIAIFLVKKRAKRENHGE